MWCLGRRPPESGVERRWVLGVLARGYAGNGRQEGFQSASNDGPSPTLRATPPCQPQLPESLGVLCYSAERPVPLRCFSRVRGDRRRWPVIARLTPQCAQCGDSTRQVIDDGRTVEFAQQLGLVGTSPPTAGLRPRMRPTSRGIIWRIRSCPANGRTTEPIGAAGVARSSSVTSPSWCGKDCSARRVDPM